MKAHGIGGIIVTKESCKWKQEWCEEVVAHIFQKHFLYLVFWIKCGVYDW